MRFMSVLRLLGPLSLFVCCAQGATINVVPQNRTGASTSTNTSSGTNSSTSTNSSASSACFPFGGATLSGTNKPSQSRSAWWCSHDLQYGFMGFSYPLESSNCNDYSNSLEKISADFARMKSQFGASMVRVYAPECRDESIWRNLLQAGIQHNMAVLPQVWWGFGDQTLWKKTKSAILAVLQDRQLGPVAPYVFHSLAFGSEPIGDGVDGSNFVNDLRAMKAALAPYGIPITISEDWDRPGSMSSGGNLAGGGLGPVGSQIASVIDLVHAHIMPYYRPNQFPSSSNVWPYFQSYISFLERNLPNKPILISETMWSSMRGGSHDRGAGNPGEDLNDFVQYWQTLENQCQYFKAHKVGWFVHTYDDTWEAGFGMLGSNGNPKMNFSPAKC